MRIRRARLAAAAVTIAAGLIGSVGTALPARADDTNQLPGGKANYVVSVIGGPVNATAVRLGTYRFLTDGRVVEEVWSWRQNSISGKGNTSWTKPSSGYRTSGCRYNCPIRTPVGFQSGKHGGTLTGRWTVSGSTVTITWSTNSSERWTVDTSMSGVAALSLQHSDSQVRGWALGSNASLNQGVTMRTLYSAQRFYGPLAENAYGSATKFSHIGFAYADYNVCSTGLCLQGKSVTAANKKTWFSSYWAANPAKDARKVYWNNQTGAVQQFEQPGSTCISASGGGHTDALLQALDDSGRIIGVVGIEASLNQRKPGQAIVSSFAMVLPTYQSLVS